MAEEARRSAWFAASRRRLRAYYLADPGNPYQQSGRSSGAVRWEATRRCIADAVHCSGSFLDVGCANGLLLESVGEWVAERGLSIEPFGLDFIEELVALAEVRVPHGTFWVGNAWSWEPQRKFTFVRTNLEYVPAPDRGAFVRRQLSWVAPGGRLMLCHYRDADEPPVDLGAFLESEGIGVDGSAGTPDHAVAWASVPLRAA